MKKILSVCLVILMALSVFSITASADAVVPGEYYNVRVGDIYYAVDSTGAYVVGYELGDTTPQAGVVIPQTIKYINKEYTVIEISEYAFYEAPYTSITLPSTIKKIGNAAFFGCCYLENVVIPNDCEFTSFGSSVFMGTSFEEKLYMNDYNVLGKNLLYSYVGNAKTFVIPDNITLLADNCFFMSKVENVVINDKITVIPTCAFASCQNLKSITIPDSVEYIMDGAFKDSMNLESVTLGASVKSLGVDCFANTKLKKIHLPQDVYNIAGAFKNCAALESVTIDPANTALTTNGKAVFQKIQFTVDGKNKSGYILQYYLPSKAQGKITLNSDVRAIGEYAFYGCSKLEEVEAYDLMYIDFYAFSNSAIKKFNADSVSRIEGGAFRGCKNLEAINLQSVDYIGVAAFENCTSLKNITLPEDIEAVYECAFANTGITEITIYGDSCYIYESAFKNCKNLKVVNLEDGVAYVGMNAFVGCSNIETISISKSVKLFDDNAFNGCENAHFEVADGSRAHDFVKKKGYDYETIGSVSFFERIANFFANLFETLFGWILG